jgi:hypothetical protein
MTQWVRPGDPLMTHWVILGDPFMAEMQKEHKPGLWLSKDSSFVCVVGVYERLPSKLSILSFFEKQCGMWFTHLNLGSSNQNGLHRWSILASYVRHFCLWEPDITNDKEYVHLVVNMPRSFPSSWLITGCVTRETRSVPLIQKELLTLPEHLSSPQVLVGFMLLHL